MAELNHHNDPTGIAQSAAHASKANYLGSHELVDRIVRSFVADVMSRFDQVASGRLVPNKAAEDDSAGCTTMGKIFAGADSRFEPVPNWSGKQLADFIRGRMYSAVQDGSDEEVISQAFAVLVHHVYDAIRENKPEEQMISDINSAISSLVLMLMGVESHE